MIVDYGQLALSEYERFNQNFGSKEVTQLSQSMQSLMDAQINMNVQMLQSMANMHAESNDKLLEAVNRPRNRTVLRDAEGKISGVKDE